MITEERIKEYALLGEGYTVDFKVQVPAKVRDLTEEVCSLANASGGYVLIGIDNEGHIHGAHIDNDKRSAIQGSIGEISPALHCQIYPVACDGQEVWVIEVPSGVNKPYTFGGCIFMREGANAQKLTNIEEIRELFQHSGKVYFDATPTPGCDLASELDTEVMQQFRLEAHISPLVTDEQVLENLQCYDFEHHPKHGAVLFFAREPQRWFFHAVTRCVRYKGPDKTLIIDDKTMQGPLMRQYQAAIDWLKTQMRVEYIIRGIGPRAERWEIPLEVFKEALVNALSHRDYNEAGAFTMVEVYDDRVEISNPGGLLPQVVPVFGRRSLSRNPFVFSLFLRMGMVEPVGSGIGRMRNLMASDNLPEPKFDTEGFFAVVLNRPVSSINAPTSLTHDQQKILERRSANPPATIKEICRETGKGRTYIYKQIAALKELGLL